MGQHTYRELAGTLRDLLSGDRAGFSGLLNPNAISSFSELKSALATVKTEYELSRGFIPAYVPYLIHFASIRSNLSEPEILQLFDLFGIEHRLVWYEAATEDLFSFDGNTVRKLSGSSSQARSHSAPDRKVLSVEIWLSGDFDKSDEKNIRRALEAFLKDVDLLPLSHDEPEIGSFFQRLAFVGRMGDYTKKLIANLRTAFGAMETAQRIESAAKLAKLLEKSNHAVLRVGNVIAVKTTKNRQTHVVVVEVPQHVERHLKADPTLIQDAARMYELLTNTAKPLKLAPSLASTDSSPPDHGDA